MSSCFGTKLHLSIFGESHGCAIGCVLDSPPAGFRPDPAALQAFLDRRAPGRSSLSSARTEADRFEILSGLKDGITTGTPLCAVIRNTDARSSDYEPYRDTPRPGHADLTQILKWGAAADLHGGGHSSGRLTAPLCFAGGLVIQMLALQGIRIGAHVQEIASVRDRCFDPLSPELSRVSRDPIPVLDVTAGERMRAEIMHAKETGDSVGGIIECAAVGLPGGIGGPMFDGVENRISQTVFAIPGIRGIEFGKGFEASRMRGSEHNDPFRPEQGKIVSARNACGGVLGGITDGMPLLFRCAVKPASSVSLPQETVSVSRGEETEITVNGRHDPCIVPRAVPCVEAACALALWDLLPEKDRIGV